MKKIFLWGAGFYLNYVYEKLDKKVCKIISIIDSNVNKCGKPWEEDLWIQSPEYMITHAYDYIVIIPQDYKAIEEKCLEMGIPKEKIVVYWKDEEHKDIFLNRSMQIKKLEDEVMKYKCRAENAPYEYGNVKNDTPIIKSGEELLQYILKQKCSLSRFGDGEFELMLEKERPWFQKVNHELALRLREVISVNKDEEIVIAIADNFGSLECYTEDSADGIRQYLSQGNRIHIMQYLDMKREYYDAYVTRPYLIYRDKTQAINIFNLFKKIWENRDVIIVEGKYSRIGIGNDLFSSARTVRRILCPQKDAWDKYEDIMQCIDTNVKKNDLICISLGPTATVMAYDLSQKGVQALDIGQLDNEYEWFLKNTKERIAIQGKMVAEVGQTFDENTTFLLPWKEQIIGEINV